MKTSFIIPFVLSLISLPVIGQTSTQKTINPDTTTTQETNYNSGLTNVTIDSGNNIIVFDHVINKTCVTLSSGKNDVAVITLAKGCTFERAFLLLIESMTDLLTQSETDFDNASTLIKKQNALIETLLAQLQKCQPPKI